MTLVIRWICSLMLLGAAAAQAAQAATPAAPVSACPAVLQHTFPRLQDEAPQSLCQYAGQVVLVVNTASYCGFTPQYKGLEALHRKYRDKGLVVLGFPSNDFAQEKGSNKDIADFCENTFGVKFPMFTASHVKGPNANPLFKQLSAQSRTPPGWNFYKYLIDRQGRVVGAWGSTTTPEDMSGRIEKLLAGG